MLLSCLRAQPKLRRRAPECVCGGVCDWVRLCACSLVLMQQRLLQWRMLVPITLRRVEINGRQADLEHVRTCPDRSLVREGVMKLVDFEKMKTQNSESSSARMLVVTIST